MAITVSLAVVVLVVTAATIRSTICFAVHLRVLARFLLMSLIHCVPLVENVPMVLHCCHRNVDAVWHGMLLVQTPTNAQPAIRKSSVRAGSAALKARNSTNRGSMLTSSLVGTSFLLPSRFGSLGRAGLGVDIRDWSTSDNNDAWATFYNLSSPTYLGGCDAWKCPMHSVDTPVIQLLWCLVTVIITI